MFHSYFKPYLLPITYIIYFRYRKQMILFCLKIGKNKNSKIIIQYNIVVANSECKYIRHTCIINVGYPVMGLFLFRIYFIILLIVLIFKIIFLLSRLEVNC